MSKRPAIQYYVGDHFKDLRIRSLTWAEKGVWWELVLYLHQSDEYGVTRQTLVKLGQSMKAPIKHLRALVDKGLLQGHDTNPQPFDYRPRHARGLGDPVRLVEVNDGKPLWFCQTLVSTEYVRSKRGSVSRFGEETASQQALDFTHPPYGCTEGESPKPPFGEGSGDGPSFAVAFALDIPLQEKTFSTRAEADEAARAGDAALSQAEAEALALRRAGCPDAYATRPELIDAYASGITHLELRDIAKAKPGKLLAYIIATAKGRRGESMRVGPAMTGSEVTARNDLASEQARAVRNLLADPEGKAANQRAYLRNLANNGMLDAAALDVELAKVTARYGPERAQEPATVTDPPPPPTPDPDNGASSAPGAQP